MTLILVVATAAAIPPQIPGVRVRPIVIPLEFSVDLTGRWTVGVNAPGIVTPLGVIEFYVSLENAAKRYPRPHLLVVVLGERSFVFELFRDDIQFELPTTSASSIQVVADQAHIYIYVPEAGNADLVPGPPDDGLLAWLRSVAGLSPADDTTVSTSTLSVPSIYLAGERVADKVYRGGALNGPPFAEWARGADWMRWQTWDYPFECGWLAARRTLGPIEFLRLMRFGWSSEREAGQKLQAFVRSSADELLWEQLTEGTGGFPTFFRKDDPVDECGERRQRSYYVGMTYVGNEQIEVTLTWDLAAGSQADGLAVLRRILLHERQVAQGPY